MADYTLTNLKEIEDQAPKFGLAPNLEARFARTPLETDHLGVSYQRLAPDFRVPFGHKHGEQEEIYSISGTVKTWGSAWSRSSRPPKARLASTT